MNNMKGDSEILKYFTGILTDTEKKELEEEISKNNLLKEEFEQYLKIWKESKNINFPDFDNDDALNQILAKTKRNNNKRPFNYRLIYIIAAAIVLIAFISYSIINLIEIKNKNNYIEITALKGEKLNIKLPDGNKIWINSNSTIKYPSKFVGINKKIEVIGEAYFELNNKSIYPIYLKAGSNTILCEKAYFYIKHNNSSGNTEIIVDNGKIFLTNNLINKSITINQEYKAYISSSFFVSIEKNNTQNYLSWKTGKLEFHEMPLIMVAQDLTKYYDIQIEIKGDLKYCKFTNNYNNKSINSILNDIKKLYNPEIIIRPDKVIILGGKCELL
jgi:ferric-dicitrate binding protein FerR (iron transport regulator)